MVSWREGPATRSMLIPLTPEIVLLDRKSMAQEWPKSFTIRPSLLGRLTERA